MRTLGRFLSQTLFAAILFATVLPASQNDSNPPAQPAWHDPSPQTISFVTVDQGVRLEVLDWGGHGRPLVLLAGLGNTAHVFDDFAPKLTSTYHVYGITRRGFGASSAPTPENNNYSADRLGDDVIAVLDSLKLERPILVGHSIAGEELSSIASRHPERVAGLVYLDAAFAYAYYDKSLGDFGIDLEDLEAKLAAFRAKMNLEEEKKRVSELQEDLPRFERDVTTLQANLNEPALSPPSPTQADLASVDAFRAWETKNLGFAVPGGEIRQQFQITASGGIGKRRDATAFGFAIGNGEEKFTDLRAPILAICVIGHTVGPYADKDPAVRDVLFHRSEASDEAIAAGFQKGVPSARVVRIHRTSHYVFIANEAEVLQEIKSFVDSLP